MRGRKGRQNKAAGTKGGLTDTPLVIAVAGNPNTGKSTLINAIAGTRLYVGNWPGVTVEKKEADLVYHGRRIKLVDLPGIYSLSPYSQEEIIARDFLIHQRPDVLINVIDSTNFERNLFLTIQLLELNIPMVVALNMYDEARQKGFEYDIAAMESILGVRVIPTVALGKTGVGELISSAVRIGVTDIPPMPRQQNYGEDIECAVNQVIGSIRRIRPELLDRYPARWLALKLMENDAHLLDRLGIDNAEQLTDGALHHFSIGHTRDIPDILADERYALSFGLARQVMKRPVLRQRDLTEVIDKIVLNRLLGIPVFIGVMWLAFKLTFDLSLPFVDWLSMVISGPLTGWAVSLLMLLRAPVWLISLMSDGIIAGVGFVLEFVPVIAAMMTVITFLESSGYMARAAFIMDRAMHAVGLHGKAFIPLLLGFGCNVPSIYATRTLETPRDKILTTLLVPLMSCGARLPVYVLFAAIFFPQHTGTVLLSLYVLGIGLAVVMGIVFKKTLFSGEAPVFIMELPPYRIPSFRNLAVHSWEKVKHFLVKAGTYILAVSILVWFVLHLPYGVQSRQESYLGKAGQIVAPLLQPLGFGRWEAGAALITGVVAKETIVGTLGEIYTEKRVEEPGIRELSLREDVRLIATSFVTACLRAADNVLGGILPIQAEQGRDEVSRSTLKQKIHTAFSPLSAYSFMVFVLLYVPCFVVGIAMRDEFGTWKWYILSVLYQTALAWIVAFVIYQGGTLMGLGGLV